MTSHLVKWHEKYSEDGLVIVDVDDGSSDSLADLTRHVEKHNIPYIVWHDRDGAMCRQYGVQYFPTAYLLGRDGKVIWQGFSSPEGEIQIREVLRRSP